MLRLLNYFVYFCILFLYIISRFAKDCFVITEIGAEVTCYAKIISLFFIFFYKYLQNFLLKWISPRRLFILNGLGFMFYFFLFFNNYLPIFHFNNIEYSLFNLKYCIALINKFHYASFYIISELSSLYISINFWIWNNKYFKKDSTSIFLFNQFAIILAALFGFFLPELIINSIYLYIVPLFLSFIAIYFFKPTEIINEPTIIKFEEKVADNRIIYIILFMTIISGMISGIIDPLWKSNIKHLVCNKKDFLKIISMVWIIQAIGTIIISKIGKKNKKFYTLFVVIIGSIFLFLIYFLKLKLIFLISVSIIMLVYKGCKYAFYNPWKENYIRSFSNSKDIILSDSIGTKYGKQIVAILSMILFSFGLNWQTYTPYSILILIFLGTIWYFLLKKIK